MQKKLKKQYIFSAIHAFFLYMMLVFTSFFAGWNMRDITLERHVRGFWTIPLYAKVNFVYSLFIFFSLASIFCLNHPTLKRKFFHLEDPPKKCRFIVKDPSFWIEISVIAVCCILFAALPPYSELIGGYFSRTEYKFLGFFVFFPILFALDFLAYFSTVSWWSGQRKKKRTEEKRAPAVSFLIQLIPTVALWIVGGYAMVIVAPMFATLFFIVKEFLLPILITVLILLAILLSWIGSRSVHARKKLIKRVKRLGKEMGFRVSVNGHPYRSAFYPDQGYHLLLQNGEKVIACRLIAAPRKRTPIYLHENGVSTFEKDNVIFKHYVSDQYFFDADGSAKKVIVVCPCRSKIFIKSDTEEKLVDVGDPVMEYRVYNSSGFINAIERQCI